MKPPFSYYGGKGRLAPWIASLMPKHRVYVEPFCGSAAVLLAKRPSVHEIINDVDGDVVNFFRVLREQPDELEQQCALTPYARDEFEACAKPWCELTPLERSRRWWTRSSQSFASTGNTTTGWATSIIRGSNNARSAANRVGRFAPVADRLRMVTIENRDALDVLTRYDAPDAVAYLDPPYVAAVRTSFQDHRGGRATDGHGRRPNGDYPHEFHTEAEHRALAAIAREYSGTVLISGYPGELSDELYEGWTRVERSVVRRASNGRSGVNPWVIEAVWINRPITDQLVFPAALELTTEGVS